MQTPTAILALTAFPLLALLMFLYLPLTRAVLWTIMIGQLLLPAGAFIKFDQIPQFDKASIPNLCIIVAAFLTGRVRLPSSPARWGVVGLLAAMFLLGPAITSQLNSDALKYGPRELPGVGFYDAGSAFISAAITLIPFFMGRLIFVSEESNRQILRILTLSMLVYSIPLLLEIRLSPQLHYWVYGYYPSDFIQSVRDGSFRPMAFMGHGLIAASFCVQALLASVALARIRSQRLPGAKGGAETSVLASPYLSAVLVACRSFGAILYGAILGPTIFLVKPRTQVRIGVLMVSLALIYPALRYVDRVPTNELVDLAKRWSPERAQSLQYRFNNERLLLHKAAERPFFGWGRFGRNRVYDGETGADVAIPDGEWVIALGQFGLIGFVAEFGLLSWSVFQAGRAFRFAESITQRIYLSTLVLLVAVNVFDLLPNGFLLPWTWLLAGSLLGWSEALLKRKATRPSLPISIDPTRVKDAVAVEAQRGTGIFGTRRGTTIGHR